MHFILDGVWCTVPAVPPAFENYVSIMLNVVWMGYGRADKVSVVSDMMAEEVKYGRKDNTGKSL